MVPLPPGKRRGHKLFVGRPRPKGGTSFLGLAAKGPGPAVFPGRPGRAGHGDPPGRGSAHFNERRFLRCLGQSRHFPAGSFRRGAAGYVQPRGAKLGLSHLPLGGPGGGRLPLVEGSPGRRRQILRRLPDRSRAGVLPHLGLFPAGQHIRPGALHSLQSGYLAGPGNPGL